MVSRQRTLPAQPAFTRQAPWSQLDRVVTGLAAALPVALLIDGLVFSVSGLVVLTGAIATAATAIFLLALWSLETRLIAVGTGWMALRARIAPSWIVVPAGDVVGVARRRIVKSGVALRLRSGPPVLLRRGDLRHGVPEALAQHFGVEIPHVLLVEDPADWSHLAGGGPVRRAQRARGARPAVAAGRPGLLAITRDPGLAAAATARATVTRAEGAARPERFGRPDTPAGVRSAHGRATSDGPPISPSGSRRRAQAWRWSALSVPSAARAATGAARGRASAVPTDPAPPRGGGADWRGELRRRIRTALRAWMNRWTTP